MKENLEDILKQEFNIEAEEIDCELTKQEAEEPEFSNVHVTDSMKQDFLSRLHASETVTDDMDDEALLAQMSDEAREAYRLGKELLERRRREEEEKAEKEKETAECPVRTRKKRPYFAAAVVAVIVLGTSVTSYGGRTYIMDMVNQVINGINHTAMDSKEKNRSYSESEIEDTYLAVNEKLGINVVMPVYLPSGYKIEETDINAEAQYAYISYLREGGKWIRYYMYGNYADQSVSIYRDDKLLSQNEYFVSDVSIKIVSYCNPENTVYYVLNFTYQNVNYEMISNENYGEIKKIMKNLFFL